MASLYRSPLRVYLLLAVFSLLGLVSAWHLPVSLFPNSSKPEVKLCIGLNLAPATFLNSYGIWIEDQLRTIEQPGLKVENIISEYDSSRACYTVQFGWGGSPEQALREVQLMANGFQGRLPLESRNRMNVFTNNENGGFFALSFYSNRRSLVDVYKLLEPILTPKLSQLPDAKDVWINNPDKRQLLIELKPETLAAFGLMPLDIQKAVLSVLESYNGGSILIDTNNLRVEIPRSVDSLEDFQQLQIPTSKGQTVSLGDLARIDLTVPIDAARIFKSSGTASVLVFVAPKPGGNIKAMSDGAKNAIDEVLKGLPKDIQYKELVNPSEFIKSSVDNVAKEVAVAAGLAVVILFLFVGNLRNVVTAAIEIPLSIILAFILMRIAGMNLNLISLGGLALSAGMNVDASVVVMENIFRHFEEHRGKSLSYEERLQIVIAAVQEVKFSVIASTIASLVVFLPLAFTSDLSYAILGDLAKAVVFSHGFSAIVALVLVPTIRLQLMKDGMTHEKPGLFERPLQKIETAYAWALANFLDRAKLRWGAYSGLAVLLAVLVIFVVPKLPREIIGKPDTDWLTLNISTSGNSMIRQMESETADVETELFKKFGDQISYTFTQIYQANGATIMFRLKDRSKMNEVWKKVEANFTNTPLVSFRMDAWNPAEMQIPDPPDFELSIHSNDPEAMAETSRDFANAIREKKLFQNVWTQPNSGVEENLRVRPRLEQWPSLISQGVGLSPLSLADLTRTATTGEKIADFEMGGEVMDIFMRFPENYVTTAGDLEALPIGTGAKIIPLKAIASVAREPVRPSIRRENGRSLFLVRAQMAKGEEAGAPAAIKSATEILAGWSKRPLASHDHLEPTMQVEDAKKELTGAIHQLIFAVSLSIGLIFLTMVFQFGSIMNSLLVLVAVPLGFIGVAISLYVFKSTLSLNSLLGVILLNGVAVANSIILVDFLQKKVHEGIAPRIAAIEVGKVRLRPILMTSLTTGLGMLPIALGIGEGGKILQPLGIAVAGGLAFSMSTTLFLVPALQVSWIEFQNRRREKKQRFQKSGPPVDRNPNNGKSRAGKSQNSSVKSLEPPLFVLAWLMLGVACLPAGHAYALTSGPGSQTPVVSQVTSTDRSLSFAEAWKKILDRNLRIESQRLQVKAGDERYYQAAGNLSPTLSLQGTASQGTVYTTPVGQGGAEQTTSAGETAALVMQANLFRSGADIAGLKASRADQKSAREKLKSETQLAEDETANALVQVVAGVQHRQIVEKIVQLKLDSLRVAQERFKQGLLPQQEVDKFSVDVENSKARLTDARTVEATAKAHLRSYLDSSDIVIEWPWREAIISGPKVDQEPFDLLKRPDFRAAQATVDAEKYRKRRALALFLPSLDFTASYGKFDFTHAGGALDWSSTLTLTIPLFDGLKYYESYRLQDVVLETALIQSEMIRRNAPTEVEDYRQSFQAARDSALLREHTAKITEKLFGDNFQRFKLGRATANDIAIDQNRLFEAELLAVDGWSSAHLSLVRLCHSLGHFVQGSGECVDQQVR